MKTTANTQINNLIQQALKISEKEIIRLAKNHLKKTIFKSRAFQPV